MINVKCARCGAKASADSFDKARKLLDHAIGLSRGKPCHDGYNRVVEIKSVGTKSSTPKNTTTVPKKIEKKPVKKETKTETFSKKDNTFIGKL